jgi:hypothetical protein
MTKMTPVWETPLTRAYTVQSPAGVIFVILAHRRYPLAAAVTPVAGPGAAVVLPPCLTRAQPHNGGAATRSAKAIAGPMKRQVRAVRATQSGQGRCSAEGQGRPGGLAELGTGQDRAVVGKADEAAVERGVPKGREQQPVVHVEALGVAAIGPRDDMGGAEQSRFGNAGHRAAATPVGHQSVSENVLADTLDYQAFGLGGARKARNLGLEAIEWMMDVSRHRSVETLRG